MEETKWLTKTKLIIIGSLISVIIISVLSFLIYRANLKKEYIKFENQLKYATPNYLLKEKIKLGSDEWRKIDIKNILAQKLVVNKRGTDCTGYVIAEGSINNEEPIIDVQIKCKNIFISKNYGVIPTSKTENNTITQTEKDTEKPKLELFGEEEIELIQGEKYVEQGAMAIDNIDGDITEKIKITGKVDSTVVGEYVMTYTVKDKAGNKSSVKRKIVVIEKNEEQEEPDENNPIEPTTPSEPDPYIPSIPSEPPVPTIDTVSPIITFNDDSLYQTICAGQAVDIGINGMYGYVARDNVDGIITNRVVITGDTGIINKVGVYSLYYNVTDNAGNKSEKVKNFSVKNCSSTIEPPKNDIQVTSVSLNPNVRTMSVGENYKLTLTINPSNATNKKVEFSSSKPSVATVDSKGNVKALSAGRTTIIVVSSNGKKGTSIITVK